jgi:hypothetical protein
MPTKATLRRDIESGLGRLDARLHWGSIFAGALMTLGFGLIFILFGNAIGLNLANTYSTTVSGGLKAATWIYLLITLVLANFIGGYFSGKSSLVNVEGTGPIHGLAAWALANLFFFSIGTLGTTVVPILLVGVANNSLNWLSFFVVTLGCAASVIAAIRGEHSRTRIGISEETERRVA